MKKKISLLLSVVLLLSVCFMPANAEDITANHNDSLLRLFTDKPAFCFYCGELHTGTGGSFVRFFHDIAHFFCGIAGTYPHPAWLMAVPEEVMREYNYEDTWIEEQKANDATNEFYDLIVSTPNIKAIVVGHDHAHFVSQVTPTLKQYMVATDEGQIFAVK